MQAGRTFLLLLLGSAHSLNHSLFLVLPPLLPLIIEETGASIQTLGVVANAGYLAYGVGALVGGALSDRVGEKRVLTMSIGLSGASTMIIYLLPNIVGLGIGFFVMSVWASLYHPVANSLISKVYSPKTAEAMGIHGAGGSLGQAFAPMISVVVGVAFGWSSSFLFYGVLAILLSVYFSRAASDEALLGSTLHKERPPKFSSLLYSLRSPGMMVLVAFNVFGGLYYRGVEFILPTFLVQSRALPLELAGMAASLVFGFAVLGQLLGGKSADRIGNKKVLIFSAVGALIGLICLLAVPNPMLGLLFFLILYGTLFSAHQPPFNSEVAALTDKKVMGAMFGVQFFITFGIGSFAASIAGYLAEGHGLDTAMIAITLFVLGGVVAALLLPERKKISYPSATKQ